MTITAKRVLSHLDSHCSGAGVPLSYRQRSVIEQGLDAWIERIREETRGALVVPGALQRCLDDAGRAHADRD